MPTAPPRGETVKIACADVTAEICLHGAHLVSFVAGGHERIFVSREAIFDGAAAIRGGVPVCFPQFSDRGAVSRKHGFARNLPFAVSASGEADTVTLTLRESAETRALWDHPFTLDVTFAVRAAPEPALTMTLAVTAARDAPIPRGVTAALHTYFAAPRGIGAVTVAGLAGKRYIDQLSPSADAGDLTEASAAVSFDREVDRIYKGVGEVRLETGSGVLRLRHLAEDPAACGGFRDAVVWNPWVDKARSIGDLGDDEYTGFFCVESAVIDPPLGEIAAGQTWRATAEIALEADK
jgi:glucose-6-phosphate 1-epimerase